MPPALKPKIHILGCASVRPVRVRDYESDFLIFFGKDLLKWWPGVSNALKLYISSDFLTLWAMIAAETGHVEILQFLVSEGAYLLKQDSKGRTAGITHHAFSIPKEFLIWAYWAAKSGRVNCLTFIAEFIIDWYDEADLMMPQENGLTPGNKLLWFPMMIMSTCCGNWWTLKVFTSTYQ